MGAIFMQFAQQLYIIIAMSNQDYTSTKNGQSGKFFQQPGFGLVLLKFVQVQFCVETDWKC